MEAEIVSSRSFNGCKTCRRRHVKCDESRPSCYECSNAGLTCPGYEKEIFFSCDQGFRPGIYRSRRPMLTVEERERMSQWLVSAVPPSLAVRHLSQIDEICDNVEALQEVDIFRGPFGAFRYGQATPVTSPAPLLEPPACSVDHSSGSESESHDDAADTDDLDLAATMPAEQEAVQSLVGTAAPLGLIDMAMTIDFAAIPDLFDFDGCDFQLQDVPTVPSPGYQLLPANYAMGAGVFLTDAATLLKHYATVCLRHMTPFRHAKTPWHVLFIPLAKSCLAAMAIDEPLDDASLCAFYGILGISASSLGGISQARSWVEQAALHYRQAHLHSKLMLSSAYQIPKAAKYKTTLTALIVMAQGALVNEQQNEVEFYLLEAERLIRLRGLKRKKSRKVRLLHHYYGFLRIFYESTHVGESDTSHRVQVRKAVEASEVVAYNLDNLAFRLPTWYSLDQEMLKVKSQDEGENDLHLERAGIHPATLYPEIFGIPEPWILMLSLSIRLGKEKDAAMDPRAKDALSLAEFSKQAEAVERCVSQLCSRSHAQHMVDESQLADRSCFQNLLDATRHALEIYFYRRVYNLRSALLQQKVMAVRDSLVRALPADGSQGHGTVSFLWPAFIAGCEAQDQEVQQCFWAWFKVFERVTGFRVNGALRTMEQVWERRRTTGGGDTTWVDLMKESQNQS